MDIKLDLSSHGYIPKIIHISWKYKTVLKDQSPMVLNGLANLIQLNPEYHVEISNDNDVEWYLKSKLKKWDYFKIKNKKIVEKVDLWRLMKIYYEGGIYVDVDRYCNISFRDIIKPGTKCILPTHGDIDFSQDIMISCPKNPIFKKAIEYNLKRRCILNLRGVFHLGPPVYMRAVTEEVFGTPKKRNPGSLVMENFRAALQNSEHFQTYKENLPWDSLIFKYDPKTFLKGNGMTKEEFYAWHDTKHWSKGYDKNTLYLFILIVGLVVLYFLASKIHFF